MYFSFILSISFNTADVQQGLDCYFVEEDNGQSFFTKPLKVLSEIITDNT